MNTSALSMIPLRAALSRLRSKETWARWGRKIIRGARSHPTTTLLVVTTTIVSLVAFVLPRSALALDLLDGGQAEIFEEPHWWSALASLLAVSDISALVITIPLMLVALGGAERLLGSRFTFIAYLGGGMCVSVAGNTIGWLEQNRFKDLLGVAPSNTVLSPTTAVLCTVVTASAFAGPLWRRRIRVTATALAVMLFLYSGTANDLFSLVAIPVGLGFGFLLGGKNAGVQLIRSSHHETRLLVAGMVAVSAIGPVIATALGTGQGLLGLFGDFGADPLSLVGGQVCAYQTNEGCPEGVESTITEVVPFIGLSGLLPVALLLIASWGIARGRREALMIALAVNVAFLACIGVTQIISIATLVTTSLEQQEGHLLQGDWRFILQFVAVLALPLGNTVLFYALRGHFRAAAAKPAHLHYLKTLGLAAGGTMLVAGVNQLAWRDQFNPYPSIGEIVAALPMRLVPPGFQVLTPISFVPTGLVTLVFWYLPPFVFWGIALWATVRLLIYRAEPAGEAERRRARQLLERGGGDTLSFMTTWKGNRYWFSPDAEAAIAYRLVANTAVTLGGPFGPEHEQPGLIQHFVRHCGDNGWTPLFYSVDDSIRATLEEHGWIGLQVAEEALLRPAEWSPAGKKRQDIRTATNRAARAGIVTAWTSWPELNLNQRSQLTALSEAWISDKELPEMGFTLGGLDELTDPAVRLMLAIDERGQVQAVTSWLPHYGPEGVDGYTLDFMRRAQDAMPGIIEFVIGAAAERMKADGHTILSLSGAPLAHTQDVSEQNGSIVRLLDSLGRALEPAYGFRSLLAFKRKFQPEFEPRWLMYPDATALPGAGLAITRSYMPQLTLRGAARLVRELGAPEATKT
ncbi:hypothetical protein C5C03_00055 [Clavibacter michiganensis]|uniref:bifunctional lysylphosphatidylglycerol flippase/synthetase MprF n=1 Tax=Clavibacter michiganensis TaxID=28447 RepID=UPI000CE8B9F5|nr:DUF2156 domain-containing protein [Clavibacter michiganensis]PPF91257.1 hypothetical protein C5C03_00055 [Clavibacter michiganensis]PPF99299.1 hypothetical protein C5C05_01860 [Clavibacter michiganensis]